MTASFTPPVARWRIGLASAWCVVFGAPHLWWALGVSAGFPGGRSAYERFMRSAWRYWYDVAVVACCVVALGLLWWIGRTRHAPARGTPWARVLLALGAVALTLRGVAGLVVDGRHDLVWWPLFLVGGLALGSVAWPITIRSSPVPRHASPRG